MQSCFFFGSVRADGLDQDPQNFLVDFHAHNAVGTQGNVTYRQRLTISSQSSVPCIGDVFLTDGANEDPDVTILTNGLNLGDVIGFTLPPGGSGSFEFSSAGGFDTFGIWIEADLPCGPNLSSVSQFFTTGGSNEAFFSPSVRIPNDHCGEFPFNHSANGTTNTGLATIGDPFFEVLPAGTELVVTLLDSDGDILEGPVSSPYSGQQFPILGSEIFDLGGQNIEDATLRVCLEGAFQDQFINVTAIGVNPTLTGIQLSGAPVTLTEPCTPDTDSVCLQENRFRVEVDFNNGSTSGPASVLHKDDSGYFYFLNPSNVDLLVKVINGCPVNDRFWVFTSGPSSAGYTIEVTDMITNQTVFFNNTLGNVSQNLDTDAFATCP